MSANFPDFLDNSSDFVAPILLGCYLSQRLVDGKVLRFKIVETEAYGEADEASHSFRGMTPKTEVMFGPSGHLYVYFTYGMHYCCNVVTDLPGTGSAVLIRALEPDSETIKHLESLYPDKKFNQITNGPAKLCKVLGIDKQLNGHDLNKNPVMLSLGEEVSDKDIVRTARIGISRAIDVPWRFYIKDNIFVSKK